MSFEEFELWTLYRVKYGPLNPVRKHDQGAALIATIVANVNGGKAKQEDFMPYGKPEVQESEVSNEAFEAMLLSSNVKRGR